MLTNSTNPNIPSTLFFIFFSFQLKFFMNFEKGYINATKRIKNIKILKIR